MFEQLSFDHDWPGKVTVLKLKIAGVVIMIQCMYAKTCTDSLSMHHSLLLGMDKLYMSVVICNTDICELFKKKLYNFEKMKITPRLQLVQPK